MKKHEDGSISGLTPFNPFGTPSGKNSLDTLMRSKELKAQDVDLLVEILDKRIEDNENVQDK